MKKKRRLRKPIKRFLQTLLYIPAAGLADLVILCLKETDPERVALILTVGVCMAVNVGLLKLIYR